jgi:DNA-binding MarR family transcriptional regulator
VNLRAPRHLDELLNYRLLRLFAISGAPVIRLLEGRYGISRREWRLLALLAVRGGLSPSGLAEEAHLDRPRATRGVQMLVEKRLAQQTPAPGSARGARIVLTRSGRKLYDELFPQIAAINARLVSVLDETTIRALDDALDKLTAEATRLNREVIRDVRADRRSGGSRRVWNWIEVDD